MSHNERVNRVTKAFYSMSEAELKSVLIVADLIRLRNGIRMALGEFPSVSGE